MNKYSNGFRKSLFKNKLAKYTSLLKNSIDNLKNIENKIKDTNNLIENLKTRISNLQNCNRNVETIFLFS